MTLACALQKESPTGFEDEAEYFEKMTGLIALFAAYTQIKFGELPAFGNATVASCEFPLPCRQAPSRARAGLGVAGAAAQPGAQAGHRYRAHHLPRGRRSNAFSRVRDPAPKQTAGYQLLEMYPRQMAKVLAFIKSEFLSKLDTSTAVGPYS